MAHNILFAVKNLIKNMEVEVETIAGSGNRMNDMGEGLETYTKNLFAGTMNVSSEEEKNRKWEKVFSWQGSKNAPPDIMIKGGDAIEVKKVESLGTDIQLNSSFPKNKLKITDAKIDQGCKDCETWKRRDIIYTVGLIPKGKKKLKFLCFVYGTEYAASSDKYKIVEKTISDSLKGLKNIELSDTNELGRVNKVDLLENSNLRVRAMWTIKNPIKVFKDIYSYSEDSLFSFMAIIDKKKYNSFSVVDKNTFEQLVSSKEELSMVDAKVKNPNNPTIEIDVKLIKFEINSWRNRKLEEEYELIYEEKLNITLGDKTKEVCVLIGIDSSGKKDFLGALFVKSPKKEKWEDFFEELKERGVNKVNNVIHEEKTAFKDVVLKKYPGITFREKEDLDTLEDNINNALILIKEGLEQIPSTVEKLKEEIYSYFEKLDKTWDDTTEEEANNG